MGCSRVAPFALAALLGCTCASACSRSAGLDGARDPRGRLDASPHVALDARPDVGSADAARDAGVTLDGAGPDSEPGTACIAADEVCNGVDDDCDGVADDGIAVEPCPGGGLRFCVAGRMSQCPSRCDVCVPGQQRVCYLPYCTYWAVQQCAADGRAFGRCRERSVPAVCDDIARDAGDSAELEQCCIDNGYCCLDSFDLDRDGDRQESIGTCEGIACGGS